MNRSLPAPADTRSTLTPAECAARASEAIRSLNRLTISYAPGYEFASDADQVLAHLRDLAQRIPQSLQQMGQWLALAESQGRLTDVATPTAQATRSTVADAIASLTMAAGYAASLGADLDRALSATSRLATDADEEPVPYLPVDETSSR